VTIPRDPQHPESGDRRDENGFFQQPLRLGARGAQPHCACRVARRLLVSGLRPLIVIGAPRSGTNMLRDCLCRLPGAGTWPCDEINFIWRYGNASFPSDAIPPDRARDAVRRYIHRAFQRRATTDRLDYVVEKTCANSLRVPFVERIFPEARYVFIVRDGVDAIASAMSRWTAAWDPLYIARKARFLPLRDVHRYAWRFGRARFQRLVSGERRAGIWGPVPDALVDDVTGRPLEEVCAVQWRECVRSAQQAFDGMDPQRYCVVRYEDFVAHPQTELRRVISALQMPSAPDDVSEALAGVFQSSVGKGRTRLGDERLDRVLPLIDDTLSRFGYAA